LTVVLPGLMIGGGKALCHNLLYEQKKFFVAPQTLHPNIGCIKTRPSKYEGGGRTDREKIKEQNQGRKKKDRLLKKKRRRQGAINNEDTVKAIVFLGKKAIGPSD